MSGENELGPWEPGVVLADTYVLGDQLGSGTMGVVHEAYDRDLRRMVAVKLPLTRRYEALLALEAQALAVLRHPGVMSVHAMPRHEDMRFLVMERLHGISLEDYLQRRAGAPLPISEVLDVVEQIAGALREIHRAGLAHRDVKPGNVMLCGSRVVVLDLGIVQPEYSSGKEHRIVGSPAYIAPEIVGQSTAPGHAFLSDVYSLGVVTFELVTGTLPYQSEQAMGALLQHLEARVPDPRERRRDTPEALAELVQSMMAKAPADRPIDMEEVVWALRETRRGLASDSPGPRPILVVDDDEDLHPLLATWLEEWAPGVPLQHALSGEEALERITERPPALVLLDLLLPGMSGLEVSMYLQGTRASDECPIIAMSGRAQTTDIHVWKGLGVSHFIRKGPSLEAELQTVVERWYGTHWAG